MQTATADNHRTKPFIRTGKAMRAFILSPYAPQYKRLRCNDDAIKSCRWYYNPALILPFVNCLPKKIPINNWRGLLYDCCTGKLMLGRAFVVSFNPAETGPALWTACTLRFPVLFVTALFVLFLFFVPFLEFHHGSSFIKQTKIYTT